MMYSRSVSLFTVKLRESVEQPALFERIGVHGNVKASFCRGCGKLVACSNGAQRLRVGEEGHDCARETARQG